MLTPLQSHFNSLFADNSDPWNYRTSWAERRRLDLITAMLPDELYDTVFEPACASGSLTERLASRARHVMAWDGSSAAITHAQELTKSHTNVHFAVKSVPEHWPDEPFDLVVLSDFLYYLPREGVVDVAVLAEQSVRPGGSIVACHWRGSAHDFCLPGGTAVHAVLADVLGPATSSYGDQRHLIEGWVR